MRYFNFLKYFVRGCSINAEQLYCKTTAFCEITVAASEFL